MELTDYERELLAEIAEAEAEIHEIEKNLTERDRRDLLEDMDDKKYE